MDLTRGLRLRFGWNLLGLPLVLLALTLYFTVQSDRFFSVANFENLGRNLPGLALLAFGQAFVLLIGQVDISVGATVGLTTVTTAYATREFGLVGLVVAPLTGALVGLVNGFLVARFRVHSVIVTIGVATVVSGLALTVTGGRHVAGPFPDGLRWIAAGTVGPIPFPLIMAVIALISCSLMLRYTTLGPKLYATGGNEEAARLAGLGVFRIKIAAFVICGLLAGVAGMYYTSRVDSGQPTLGQGLELQSIAAAVVGGMALTGGKGRLTGVALGVLVLVILQNGLDITNVSSYTQRIISGIVILAAVIVDRLRESRSSEG